MTDIADRLRALDRARAGAGLPVIDSGLPSDRVRARLEAAGVTAHPHLVEWYSHFGIGSVVHGAVVRGLEAAIDSYRGFHEVAEDFRDADPQAYSEATDWIALAFDPGTLVIWARPCAGDPPVAHQTLTGEISPPLGPFPVTLPELLDAWTARLDQGLYELEGPSGRVVLAGAAPVDDVSVRSGL